MLRIYNAEELARLRELLAMAKEGGKALSYPLDIFRTERRMSALDYGSCQAMYTYTDVNGRAKRESSELTTPAGDTGMTIRRKLVEAEKADMMDLAGLSR